MFQKFYTDTLINRYIKSLLAQTNIPVYDCVCSDDYVVSGCYYIYGSNLIKCTSQGVLEQDAAYDIIKTLDVNDLSYCSNYTSTCTYYDPETHKQLGRYLRFLRTTKNINLLPFYNCYNSFYLSDVELKKSESTVDLVRVASQKTKVIAIPVQFGKTYKLYVDSPTEVLIRGCVYDNSGFVNSSYLSETLNSALNNSAKILSTTRFNEAVELCVSANDLSSSDMAFERNLYFVVQLALSNDSSIVVIEKTSDNKEIINPSMLYLNTREVYAFPGRLVEYLVGNVICEQDVISKNIRKIQHAFCESDASYAGSMQEVNGKFGFWDSSLPLQVEKLLSKTTESRLLFDHDLNINRDVELILHGKGGNY